MVRLKARDAGEVMGVMAIGRRVYHEFSATSYWKTVKDGSNHGRVPYLPEPQEPYCDPDLALPA